MQGTRRIGAGTSVRTARHNLRTRTRHASKVNDASAAPRSAGPYRDALASYGMLTIVVVCWAANTVFAKLAVGEIPPMLLVSLRWFAVLLLVVPFSWRQLRRDWPVLVRHWKLIAALGAFGFTAFNALYYSGAHYTTALNMGIIQGTTPALVLLGLLAAYGTRVSPVQAGGVALTFLGIAVVASNGALETLATFRLNAGDLLLLLACVLYAGYTVWLRKRPPVSPLSQFTLMAAGAFAASLPLVAGELASVGWTPPTSRGLLLVGLIALFPSLIAQLCFIEAVVRVGPARAGVFVNLVPVVGSVLAVWALNERFAPHHLVALVFVLAGVALSERAR